MNVKLRQLVDVKEGEDPIKEFELEHATRILNVRVPIKTWKLEDENFKFENGEIKPIE